MTTLLALALPLSLIAFSLGVAHAQSTDSVSGGPYNVSARWSQYLHRTFGPSRLGTLAAETAVDQGFGTPSCWDDSGASYAQRYARAFDRRLIRNTSELAAGILTGEDLRFQKSQSHAVRARIWNAVRTSVEARMPDGTERPAYTRFLASAITELSTAHWAGQPIQANWLFQALAWSTLGQVETNLLDEFGPDIRRVAGRLRGAARNRTRHRIQP
jgi:hypothetical protein